MTDVERRTALEEIAAEVRVCTNCRLHQTRTKAVPGEGDPDTEVVFVGEGPGFNEDREGRPFIGRAGDLLVKLLASIGWRREDVFITNVVKCRPPDNRDPQPDEIAACAPYLRRQLEVLDPAVVVTARPLLDGHVHARRADLAGARHGPAGRSGDRSAGRRSPSPCTTRPPRSVPRPSNKRVAIADIAAVPAALLDSRRRRETTAVAPTPAPTDADQPEAVPRRTPPSRRGHRPRNSARHHPGSRTALVSPRRPRPPTRPPPN